MSRMIPPFYDESIRSDGEKKVFHKLSKLDDKYIILHSLGVAQHREKIFGEIDFVIICPQGILCLEVKGGFISRQQGFWYFTDRYGKETKDAEGPFRQVLSGMMSLRDLICKNFGPGDPTSKCQYACGVIFPDMPFSQKGPDIIPEIIFDARKSDEDMERYIQQVFAYWKDTLKEKHGIKPGKLNLAQIARVENYLRGDFSFIPSLGFILEKTGEKLIKLTQEQFQRLAIIRENPRVLLMGGAGTGKTLISMEHARRCALEGKRVLYLCFNRNLAKHLSFVARRRKDGYGDNIYINTLHGYLFEELQRYDHLPAAAGINDEDFYRDVLPEAFLNLTQEPWYHSPYDTFVVDEGQDLFSLEYIICLDALMNGGLMLGNWYFCYDPNQNIYNPTFESGLNYLKEYNPTVLTLDTNCRNTRSVGIYNTLYTGVPPARRFLIDGEVVIKDKYIDTNDQVMKVQKTVKKLIGQGVKPGSICLLSKYRYENSCLRGENIFRSICRFQNATDVDPQFLMEDSVKFCTIHSFKGLEAPVIILLDIDNFKDTKSRLLNYIAMSRATSLLCIFYKADAEEELNDITGTSAELLKIIED